MAKYDLWFAEHGIIEWATAFAFLTTALIAAGLWLCRKRVASLDGLRIYLCIVFPLALVALLDELSFGKDFIGYQPPVVGDYGITSVHDLMLPIARSFRLTVGLDLLPAALALMAIAIAVTGVLAWALRCQLSTIRLSRGGGIGPAWLGLGCTLFLGVMALFIDSAGPIIMPSWRAYLLGAEELIELVAALSLLAGIVWLQRRSARHARGPEKWFNTAAKSARHCSRWDKGGDGASLCSSSAISSAASAAPSSE